METDEKVFHIRTFNDGEMIPDTMKEEIFKPFVRLDKEDEVTTGTGIGLALSRSLAELHQGSLMMEKGEEVIKILQLLSRLKTYHRLRRTLVDGNRKKPIRKKRNR